MDGAESGGTSAPPRLRLGRPAALLPAVVGGRGAPGSRELLAAGSHHASDAARTLPNRQLAERQGAGGATQYLIKWRGYEADPSDDSWQTADELANVCRRCQLLTSLPLLLRLLPPPLLALLPPLPLLGRCCCCCCCCFRGRCCQDAATAAAAAAAAHSGVCHLEQAGGARGAAAGLPPVPHPASD